MLNELLEQTLRGRLLAGQLRVRRAVRVLDSTHVEVGGRRLINFSSNDYLGLTHHPQVVEAAAKAMVAYGVGSGASALVSGYSMVHEAAEAAVARWKQTGAAVLMPSGYQAAQAVMQTLAVTCGARVRFLLDKLCHASLIDAAMGVGMPYRVYPHNHMGKLCRLLETAPTGQVQVVITESVFSMDGDAADLAGLAELKAKYPFVLVLDEAHGSGVYGPGGTGYSAECGLGQLVDVTIVTLSKALGLIGGAVCGSQGFCEALVNCGRAYMYSTSPPAMVAAAAMAAIEVLGAEPDRQSRVRELARRVRGRLGGKVMAGSLADCPIIPIILKTEQGAMSASEQMRERGMLLVAIRPPTVARGSSRLRVTVSSEHTDQEIESLVESLKGLRECAAL